MTDDALSAPLTLNRRQAIARLAVLFGSTLIGGEFILDATRLRAADSAPDFSADDLALMDEIGDTIIPATDTPGAKAAQIGAFMALIVRDCYTDAQQQVFRTGLKKVDAVCRTQTGKAFVAASPHDRLAVLNNLNEPAAAEPAVTNETAPPAPPHYLTMLKQLTILGYFTSEIGCTQALRYIEVPAAFHGDVPYKPGERAWFNTVARPLN